MCGEKRAGDREKATGRKEKEKENRKKKDEVEIMTYREVWPCSREKVTEEINIEIKGNIRGKKEAVRRKN